MLTRIAIALLLAVAFSVASAAESPKKSKAEWEVTKTLTGTITNTTINNGGGGYRKGGNNGKSGNNNSVVRPVYESFSTESPVFRIKWEVNATEKRGDIRVMLDREVERGKSKDWRSAGSIGPIRLGEKGEKVIALDPGNYRLEMTGYTVKYTFTVEEAKKAE